MKINNKIIRLKRFTKSICHCERNAAILLALALLALSLISAIPAMAQATTLNVVPFTVETAGGGTATWSDADFHTGSYSVLLTAEYPYSASVGIPVNIPLAGIDQLSFWYNHKVYSPAAGHVLGPDLVLILSNGTQYYVAGRGGASSSVGSWLEADPITPTNFAGTSTWFCVRVNVDLTIIESLTPEGGYATFDALKVVPALADATVLYAAVNLDPPGDGSTGSVYVDDITVNGTTYYGKIQDAIDAASPGDIIIVAAGTYDSSIETFPININKSLTLLGAQANVDPRPSQGGRIGSESTIDADETNSAVLQITSASDVEINGFTITGGTGDMVEESTHANNLLFCYNILYDDPASAGDEAIQIKYSDGVVMEYNYAYNIVQDAFNLSTSTNGVVRYNEMHNIYSENAAIYCYDATNIDIIGNLVYDIPINDGIKLGDADDGSTGGIVKDNKVHDAAEDGITIYASGVTVENNTIYNCNSENGALYLYGADNTTVKGNEIHNNAAIGLLIHKSLNVKVMSNNIYNNDDSDDTKYTGSAGIWLTSEAEANTININYNNIYGNADFGLKNEYNAIVDATNNWWGDTSGPTHTSNPGGTGDAVSDNVNFVPFLSPNITITKTGPATANKGNNITYTITYKNVGTFNATNVVITETYPSEVEYVSANPAPAIGNNQWTIPTLAPGAEGTITVTVHIK